MISIEVDRRRIEVPVGFSVKEALESLGYNITMHPADKGLFMPCQVGGCWACALEIDGEVRPACSTQVQEGMRIKTGAPRGTPQRMVAGFMGHKVGGVGTPWWLESGLGFIEVWMSEILKVYYVKRQVLQFHARFIRSSARHTVVEIQRFSR